MKSAEKAHARTMAKQRMHDTIAYHEPDGGAQENESPRDEHNWVIRSDRQVLWALAIFVFANVAALSLNYYLNRQVVSQFTPMLDGVLHVKQSVIRSHLWLRERLHEGDRVGLDDVTWNLDEAQATILNVLAGRQIHLLPFAGNSDIQLSDEWSLLLEKVRKLEKSTESVIAGTGDSKSDDTRRALSNFDISVRDVISFADLLEAMLEKRIGGHFAWLEKLQLITIGFFIMLVGIGAIIIQRSFRQLFLEVRRRYRAERALQRSREKAIAARDELKIAARFKDQLLGKIGHEVRTPINGIIGLATLIESTNLTETQRSYLQMLESETHTLWRIMEDLVDLSKLESRKLSINPGVIDLRRIAVDAVDLCVNEAEAKGILLDIDIALDFPRALVGDRIRIRQIVLNLLNNAIKFTDRGSVVAGLRGRPLEDKRCEVTIWVRDTGMGIPLEKRQHVFDPFSQADDSTTRRFGGTGLGLTICRELVSLMGGNIEFSDTVGGGTTFTLRLPLAFAEGTADIPPPRLDGQRLLVVDRDDELRRRTCELLSELGAEVQAVDGLTLAVSALEAALAEPKPYDAVIANDRVSMIALDELLSRIRCDERHAKTRIVLLRKNSASLNRGDACASDAPLEISVPHRALELPHALLDGTSAAISSAAAAKFGAGAPAFYSGARALLVDDHPVMQIAGRHMLESIGCRVDSAQDGRSALEQWQARKYDVIFLDWEMPDMDGLEVARQIRRIEADSCTQRSYLVAITANAMACDRERCLEAGMDEYISKPVTKEAFIRVLRHFVDDSRAQQMPH